MTWRSAYDAARERPALAEVLAALTTQRDAARWREMLGYDEVSLGDAVRWGVLYPPPRGLPIASFAWLHPDPREALEALQAAGLAPEDDGRRRWWCPTCRGRGLVGPDGRATDRIGGWMCGACDAYGHAPLPPDLRTLAAVASLGPARWLAAEELARVVEDGAVPAWRAAAAEDIRAELDPHLGDPLADPALRVSAAAWFHPDDVADEIGAAEDALREGLLAARASAQLAELGARLVGRSGRDVVLCVEAW